VQANERFARNLVAVHSSTKSDKLTRDIANDIFAHGGYLPQHPTNI
jgi:hypothetical protein